MKKNKNHFDETQWSWFVTLKGSDIKLAVENKFNMCDLFVMMKIMNYMNINGRGKCWVKNNTIAEIFGISERSVAYSIAKMNDCGMIIIMTFRNATGTWRMMYTPESFAKEWPKYEPNEINARMFFDKNGQIFDFEHNNGTDMKNASYPG